MNKHMLLAVILWMFTTVCNAQVINLEINYKTICIRGKTKKALAVNDQIPGPTLYLKEGEPVTINVCNRLDEGTTLHWHGVLVPWQMDGVNHVSQNAIKPGTVFQYRFTPYQSGTYWYHSHTEAQEQEGLYGAIIIKPKHSPKYHYTKDHSIVMSDIKQATGESVFLNLKKDGDYYAPKFALQASLEKFLQEYFCANCDERKKIVKDYKQMQETRMSPYDLSDVAYDAYLLEGKTCHCPWQALVKVSDIVRLRFIGAMGSTIYRIKIPNECMQVVHLQGNDVKPYVVSDFTLSPGETVDVLVKIKEQKPYVIYAESNDKVGMVYGALLTDRTQCVDYQNICPFPEPEPVSRQMMHNMMETSHHKMSEMHKTSEKSKMSSEPTIVGDSIVSPCPELLKIKTHGTKYQNIVAENETNDPHKPVSGIIKMELFGYMDSYIWVINGLPEYKVKPILIEPGKRYRIIFTNHSMMNHPMHIHGHWFILRNGHGSYDPLLHTLEAAPGSTIVADVDADASGQWFFHCHHIYHMMAGMSRVFQYDTLKCVEEGLLCPASEVRLTAYKNRPIVREDAVLPIDPCLVEHPKAHSQGFYCATFLDLSDDPFHNIQEITFKGLYGRDYDKLELLMKEAEIEKGKVDAADLDIFYWHHLSQFWAFKAGINYFNQPSYKPYWQPGLGIEGVMPYFIETDIRAYFRSGAVKFDIDLSRDTQITNNFFIQIGMRSILATRSVIQSQIGSGMNQVQYTLRPFYRLKPGLTVYVEYEYDQNYGTFKRLRQQLGDPVRENTIKFGITMLF